MSLWHIAYQETMDLKYSWKKATAEFTCINFILVEHIILEHLIRIYIYIYIG